MFPYFTLFGKVISMYAVFALIGGFTVALILINKIKKKNLDDNDAIVFMLFVALGVVLGCHILYGLTNLKLFPKILEIDSFKCFIDTVVLIFGGSVFYGGLFGGIIAGVITLKVKKLDFNLYAANMAYLAPLFHGIARIGCFFGGCCYGIESKFGFTFHGNTFLPEVNDVRRFPVQLLEALLNFIIAFVFYRIYQKKDRENKLNKDLFFYYLMTYSIIRFADEFLRGDALRGFVFGLSTSQFISAILLPVSIILIIVSKNSKKTLDK